MRKTSLLGAAVCALALAGMSTSPASAAGQAERGPDKVKVNYEMGTDHANSICSYSGQNDNPDDEFPEGGRVQSYGQLVKLGLKAEFPSPGEFCNGHKFPYPEGFGPEAP